MQECLKSLRVVAINKRQSLYTQRYRSLSFHPGHFEGETNCEEDESPDMAVIVSHNSSVELRAFKTIFEMCRVLYEARLGFTFWPEVVELAEETLSNGPLLRQMSTCSSPTVTTYVPEEYFIGTEKLFVTLTIRESTCGCWNSDPH